MKKETILFRMKNMSEEMDKMAVRAYLTRIYLSAKIKDDQYVIDQRACRNIGR